MRDLKKGKRIPCDAWDQPHANGGGCRNLKIDPYKGHILALLADEEVKSFLLNGES